MESACPDGVGHAPVTVKGEGDSILDLVCRLVRKGDGKDRPRGRRLGDKLGKYLLDIRLPEPNL